MSLDPATIGAAVRAADTYQAAAEALGLSYGAVYRAARKIGARPRLLGSPARPCGPSRHRLNLLPQEAPPPPARPAPPATLSAWLPLTIVVGKHPVIAIRIDEAGRVRAAIADLGDGWCSWTIRDAAGAKVGKVGLRGSRQEAEAGADEALFALRWLDRARVDRILLPDFRAEGGI